MAAPIFILGLTQRSGTNLLYRALLAHPDCDAARQPGEDFLLHEADLLERYVERVSGHWHPDWNRGGARAQDLRESLGRALVEHLRPASDRAAFVSKTPSARNLTLLARFVPGSRVLLLIRDGRDVVESGVRGFGWTYREGFRRWARAAQELARSLDGSDRPPFTMIRFEALVESPRAELRRALSACGLDEARYPFDTLSNLPIYGSSQLRGGRADVHWEPVAKGEGFNPVGRWLGWDDALKLEYERVCGTAAERLGYARGTLPHGTWTRLAARLRGRLERR